MAAAIEPVKRIVRFAELRLRGPTGACDDIYLAAAVQNLSKMARIIPIPKIVMAEQ